MPSIAGAKVRPATGVLRGPPLGCSRRLNLTHGDTAAGQTNQRARDHGDRRDEPTGSYRHHENNTDRHPDPNHPRDGRCAHAHAPRKTLMPVMAPITAIRTQLTMPTATQPAHPAPEATR